jgi:hypothetical protein
MHYQPGTSDQKHAQEGPRPLAVAAASASASASGGGRRLERQPEHQLEQTRARWVGLEPPHEYRAGMVLNMTHEPTGVRCTPFFKAQTNEQPMDDGNLSHERKRKRKRERGRSTTTRGGFYKHFYRHSHRHPVS